MVIRMVIRMVSRMVIRMVSRMVILWLYGVLEGPQYAPENSQQARGRPRKTNLRLPPAAGGTPQTPTD
jgi:hypothetical protein